MQGPSTTGATVERVLVPGSRCGAAAGWDAGPVDFTETELTVAITAAAKSALAAQSRDIRKGRVDVEDAWRDLGGHGRYQLLESLGSQILPIIASLSEDALYAVPTGMREGSYALGADKISTIFRVVIPSAFSGIAASVILGISRGIGETMIVAIAAGQQPRFTLDPRVPIETMTAYIVQVSLGDTPAGTLEYRTIFAVGAALFVMTLGLNLISHRLRRRIQRGGTL